LEKIIYVVNPSPVKLFTTCTWSSDNAYEISSQERGHSEMTPKHHLMTYCVLWK